LELSQEYPELALDIVDRLIVSAPRLSPGDVITFLWKLKGDSFVQLGRVDEAQTLLCSAIENIKSTGEQFLLWRIHASLGKLYKAMNRYTNAKFEFSLAYDIIEKQINTIPDKSIRMKSLQRSLSVLRSYGMPNRN